MKLIKYLFVLVVVVATSLSYVSGNVENQDSSLEMSNAIALADGEYEVSKYTCAQPPRIWCIFIERDGQIITLYGHRTVNY